MNSSWIVVLAAASVLVTGFWLGRKSKHGAIDRLKNSIEHHKYQLTQLKEQAEAAIQKLRMEQVVQQSTLQKRETARNQWGQTRLIYSFMKYLLISAP